MAARTGSQIEVHGLDCGVGRSVLPSKRQNWSQIFETANAIDSVAGGIFRGIWNLTTTWAFAVNFSTMPAGSHRTDDARTRLQRGDALLPRAHRREGLEPLIHAKQIVGVGRGDVAPTATINDTTGSETPTSIVEVPADPIATPSAVIQDITMSIDAFSHFTR